MKNVINIKADKDVKEDAKRLAEEMGLSLSALVNAFLKQFVRDREFTLAAPPRMSAKLEKYLEKIEADIKAGRNLSPAFDNAEDAIKYLRGK